MRMLTASVICLVMLNPGLTFAQTCIDDLVPVVEDICGTFVAAEGGVTSRSAEVELNATVRGWLQKIVGIGARAGGEISEERFENILREHIAADWQDVRRCRVELVLNLADRVCPAGGSTPAAPVREASPRSGPQPPEGLSPADAEIWTRLMPRPGQVNRAEMCCIYSRGWCTPYSLEPLTRYERAEVTVSDLYVRCYCLDDPGIVGQNCP